MRGGRPHRIEQELRLWEKGKNAATILPAGGGLERKCPSPCQGSLMLPPTGHTHLGARGKEACLMQSTEVSLLQPRVSWRKVRSGCGGARGLSQARNPFCDSHKGPHGPTLNHMLFSLPMTVFPLPLGGISHGWSHHHQHIPCTSHFCVSQPQPSLCAGKTLGRRMVTQPSNWVSLGSAAAWELTQQCSPSWGH